MPKKYSIRLPRDAKSRRVIKEALAGYRRMNEFTEGELRRDLPRMTKEESLRIFKDLDAVRRSLRTHSLNAKGEEALERLHVQELVELRKLWNKIAQGLANRK